MISRLHIAHSYVTHSFFVEGRGATDVCVPCDEQVKVEHINLDFFVGLRWKVLGGFEIKLRIIYHPTPAAHFSDTIFEKTTTATTNRPASGTPKTHYANR